MPGFGGILSIARGALSASQAAVQIASHNIANANTPGYSRQREVLSTSAPEHTPLGIFGTGVTLSTVQRLRDGMLDQEFRNGSAQSSASSMRSELLQRVETVFSEPSDTGLSFALDQFYNAWSDLASNPSNASAKTVVQQRGSALAAIFNGIAGQLDRISAETIDRAQASLGDINRIALQVADLNRQIVPMESAGDTAGDLRDQRDMLLDTLGKLATVRVIDRPDGSNQVLLGTLSLVDGNSAKQLQLSTTSGSLSLQVVGSADNVRNIGGSLGALQDVHNTDLVRMRTSLDTLAAAVVNDTNTLHRTGWSPPAGAAGNWNPATPPTGSGIDFFDATPLNVSAGRIRLSATIAADAGNIASGTALNESGNNALALAMAALRDGAPSAANTTFGADLRAIIGDVAGQVNQAKNSTAVYGALTDQADQRRTAVFGVSVDEELIQVMRQQQAYAAASKIISTVDEMMQTLLALR